MDYTEFLRIVNFIILFVALWIILKPYFISKRVIDIWGKNKNIKILSKQLRFIRTGPFSSIFSGLYRPVYRIEISKSSYQIEKGWLKIGGIFSEYVSVIWDSDLENPSKAVRILDAIWGLFIIIGFFIILFLTIEL